MSIKRNHLSSIAARRRILAGNAPANLIVHGHLDLSGQTSLRELPPGLTALSLNLNGCLSLSALPEGLTVSHVRLDNCPSLRTLPTNFACDTLEFRNGLIGSLPDGLRVIHKLDLSDCAQLTELPEGLSPQSLILRRCVSLTALPGELTVAELDIAGCSALADWPGPVLNIAKVIRCSPWRPSIGPGDRSASPNCGHFFRTRWSCGATGSVRT